MSDQIYLEHRSQEINQTIQLPSSKSESNRALIIHALSGFVSQIENLSIARDTQTMLKLLKSTDETLDVIDAGTTMRFLCSYMAMQSGTKILTGTERMCERPIGLLVDALRTIGADISYLKNEGYPPVCIKGPIVQKSNQVTIRADVSSQFISSLLMIAPLLPKGLEITLYGEVGSLPYIHMTIDMMRDFGVHVHFNNNILTVRPQTYTKTTFYVESDWSGASYWYSMAALSKSAKITLIGLKQNSLQGDSAIVDLIKPLGVDTQFESNKLTITKRIGFSVPKSLEIDFTQCPDIAQTLAVLCAALGVELVMKGVESLKIKETDRLTALQNELHPFGIEIVENGPLTYIVKGKYIHNSAYSIKTYKDHRMAMAFAPLALKGKLTIEHPEVVVKSYPTFWEDLKVAGFIVT